MPPRIYLTNAERQKAYRERKKAKTAASQSGSAEGMDVAPAPVAVSPVADSDGISPPPSEHPESLPGREDGANTSSERQRSDVTQRAASSGEPLRPTSIIDRILQGSRKG